MKTLSITFHCTAPQLQNWTNYLNEEFISFIENMETIDQYIFSEVHSEMIEEGKNFNLFLFLKDEAERSNFIENKVDIITEKIGSKFGSEVMVFLTLLNPIQYRIN